MAALRRACAAVILVASCTRGHDESRAPPKERLRAELLALRDADQAAVRADRDALDPGDRFGARERDDGAAGVTTSRSGTRQSVMRSQIIFCDGGASCSRKQATN